MENTYDEENSSADEKNENSKENRTDSSGSSSDQDTNENGNSDDWKTIEEDPTKIKIESNPGELVTGFVQFLKSVLSLRRTKYNYKKVVKEVKDNVVFEGYNVWILACSIVVASIGLNMDSVAVVIGAMLISPLMGPIRGIGFGVGMNDLPLLKSSVKNFGVMVGISLLTSFIYFVISPIDVETVQLLGRTEPNFLDAMIAFFGGLAGIIAATNGKVDTVISGVAIATALMPPLCTAGWGLANGEWTYFLGASYLFLLNSLFIALSTVVLLRYVRFPKREYISAKIERKVQNYIIIFMVLIIAPSAYLFYRMAVKSSFEENSLQFVEKEVKSLEENIMVDYVPKFSMDGSVLELAFINTYIDSTTIGQWNRKKVDYGLKDVELNILQGEDINALVDRKIKEDLGLSGNQNELINMLKEKELMITRLQSEYQKIQTKEESQLDLDYILRSFQNEFSEVNKLSVNRSFTYNKNKIDTTYIIAVNFKDGVEAADQKKVKKQMSKRFCFELKEKENIALDSVSIVNL